MVQAILEVDYPCKFWKCWNCTRVTMAISKFSKIQSGNLSQINLSKMWLLANLLCFLINNDIISEVYNRVIWSTFFTCNFQINKKAYLQNLKFLPIAPNISMTPIYTKKIITLKKDICKSENTHITLFIVIIF